MKNLFLLAAFYCLHVNNPAQCSPKMDDRKFGKMDHPKVDSVHRPVIWDVGYERAQRHFARHYRVRVDTAWKIFTDGGFICRFRQDEVINEVFYAKNGRWSCTILRYDGWRLAPDVKRDVQRAFEGYTVTHVNEINSDAGIPVYIITIETSWNIKVIRVAGDQIDVREEYQKSCSCPGVAG
jgi:hypothetical protein